MVRLRPEYGLDAVEMRAAYCSALIEAAQADPRVIALDCDLGSSMGTQRFAEAFPDRHLNCGIQEANACGVAAGLSLRGFVPFLHTFAVFASRRILDQLYISCAFAGLNVKVLGGDPGVSAAVNGGTHMAMEDVGALRSVPNLTILEPSDAVMMKSLVGQMAKQYGVHYMRMQRKRVPALYAPDSTFEIGKAALLREGADVTLIASGLMVHEALRAAERLMELGISARVLDMFTIKPIDREAVIDSARKTGAIVTAENHNVIGGLSSAVAEVLAACCPVPMERVGVTDQFGEVGTQEYLMERFHLTGDAIFDSALKVIARKNW